MHRRSFLAGWVGVVAAPLAAEAQRASTAYRIGVLSPWSPSEPATAIDGFRRGLRNVGYAESDGIQFEYRTYEDRFPTRASELVALKVDVIIAATVPAIRAAQRATTTIPIVMMFSSDPVRLGLVKSLAQPGGNTTGLAPLTFDLAPKRLELLRDAVPRLGEVAVLWNPANPAVREGVSQTKDAARTLGVKVQPFEVSEASDLDAVFAAILRERPDGLIVVPDAFTDTHRTRIADFAVKHRLPSVWGPTHSVDVGGLIAYGIHYEEHLRDAARYVVKILKGGKPADLPVEQPTKVWLAVNLKTAKTLGLTIPPSLLLRADQVIQ